MYSRSIPNTSYIRMDIANFGHDMNRIKIIKIASLRESRLNFVSNQLVPTRIGNDDP